MEESDAFKESFGPAFESAVVNLLQAIAASLEGGQLKDDDAEIMRELRKVMQTELESLRKQLRVARLIDHDIAKAIADAVGQLLMATLRIGLLVPASSKSAQTAANERRTQRARKGREPKSNVINQTIQDELRASPQLEGLNDNAAAKKIRPNINKKLEERKIPPLGQSAITKRVEKLRRLDV